MVVQLLVMLSLMILLCPLLSSSSGPTFEVRGCAKVGSSCSGKALIEESLLSERGRVRELCMHVKRKMGIMTEYWALAGRAPTNQVQF